MSSVLERHETTTPSHRSPRSRLLPVGIAAFAVVLLGWLIFAFSRAATATIDPADLQVYKNGGLIVRHVTPAYDPSLPHPLYDWPLSKEALKFTYTPFAAIFFAVVSFIPWSVLPRLSQVANLFFLVLAGWCAMGALGYRDWRTRAGGALLGAAAGLLTEPVYRTMYLGQVNLLLMAALIWDLRLPDRHRYKGAAAGLAAGIKLVPLVFIPYLLLTRRFRAAWVASVTFAGTIVLGFVIIPGDSSDWWLGGLFYQDGRTGFVGWGGNQSLRGLLTRLAGSIDGATASWAAATVIVAVAGLTCAVLLDRAGHGLLAILAAALVGLLDSPVSWDHHWVWVVPGMMAAAHYAVRAWQAGQRNAARWRAALAAALLLVFAPWPGLLWSNPSSGPGNFTSGFIWAGPNSPVKDFVRFGDQASFEEYHWSGLQNLSGNAFILAGIGLLVVLAVTAVRTRRAAAARPA